MKKLKKGQIVVWQGGKYEFVEYPVASQTGEHQRVLLKKGGVDAFYEVFVKELEVPLRTTSEVIASTTSGED